MKSKNILALFGFVLILVGIELDIFLPTLSIMQQDLQATDGEINWGVTVNLLGFAGSTLFYGSLSDSFGRRPIILFGLLLFFLGSLGCYLSSNLSEFLWSRFIQGIGCGAPLTTCYTSVLDIFENKNDSDSAITLLNSLITGATTVAPILGAYIGSLFSWRANFALLTLGSLLAFLMVWLFLPEPLPDDKKNKWQFKKAINQYGILLLSKKSWYLGLIPILMYCALLIYLVNFPLAASVLKIQSIGYMQSFVMLSFVLGSAVGVFLIPRLKTNIISGIAYTLSCGGVFLLLIGSYIFPHHWYIITFLMGVVSSGIALVIGLHMGKSLDAFPEFRGISTAFQGALRLVISSILLMVTGLFIHDNFFYICLIMGFCIFGSFFLYLYTNQLLIYEKN